MCAWSGGNYTKGNAASGGWTGDASLGIGIEAGRHDTQDNDFATGINQCLNKDGSNAATGNLNLGGFLPTNIGAGTAAAPAICAGGDVNTGIFSPAADQIGVATNGAERIRIDANGKVGIGTTSPTNSLDIATTSTTAAQVGANITAYNTDTGKCAELNLFKSNNATSGSNTLVTSGTYLGAIRFYGANGTSFNQSALIAAAVDGTPGATNDMPSRLEFYTTADGSASPTERMRIRNDGNCGIGNAGATASRLEVQGIDTSSSNFALTLRASSAAHLFYARNDGLINTGLQASSPYNLTTGSAANIFVDANGTLFRSTSSLKYKTDVRSAAHGLAEVLQLRPVTFKGNKDGNTVFGGLIAEEVDAIGLHEFVQYASDGTPDALHYGNMVSLAFKAIQELNAKVVALEAKVAALES